MKENSLIVLKLLFVISLVSLQLPLQANVDSKLIPLADFQFTNPTIEGYAPIRASYETTGDDYILRVNADTPHRCFGWIEGPRFEVQAADDDEIGSMAGITVSFHFKQDYFGNPPELRVRMNSSSFLDYGVSGVPPGQFNALRNTGIGEVTAILDRRNLDATNNLRLYIDLFSHWSEGQVDPNFWVRIDKVEVFTISPEEEETRDNLISAGYMEADGDVFMHVGGNRNRFRIRSSAGSYAYDGAYAITIDDRELHAYSTYQNLSGIQVEGDDVISAAISDEHVIYLEIDGDVKYYNINTREKRRIGNSQDFYLVTSSDDGTLLVAELGTGGRARYYYYDTNVSQPSLQRLTDSFEIILIRTRDTGRETASKRNFFDSSDMWPLLQ